MKVLLTTATLAAILVSTSVVAQATEENSELTTTEPSSHDESFIIKEIETILETLGGLDGVLGKLKYVGGLVRKALTDKGIGGFIARGLVNIELEQIKGMVIKAQNKALNKLLDDLEKRIGLRKKSSSSSLSSPDEDEQYFLDDAARMAIDLIKKNMKEILDEIRQAQKENNEKSEEFNEAAIESIAERIAKLKLKLKALSKKLMDIVLRRKKETVDQEQSSDEVEQLYSSASSYIAEDFVRAAVEQIKIRIMDYMQKIRETKKVVEESTGTMKEKASAHLKELTDKLKNLKKDLMDIVMGRKTGDGIEKEINDDNNYIVDDAIRTGSFLLRMKIQEILEKIAKVKDLVKRTAGDSKDNAEKQLKELQNKMKQLMKDLKDTMMGRKNTDEQKTDDVENYIGEEIIRSAADIVRARLADLAAKIKEAKEATQKSAGESKEKAKQHLKDLQDKMKNLVRDLKDIIMGRKTNEEIEQEINNNNNNYIAEDVIRTGGGFLRMRIQEISRKIAEARDAVRKSAGESKENAKIQLKELQDRMKQLLKDLKETMMGKKIPEETAEQQRILFF